VDCIAYTETLYALELCTGALSLTHTKTNTQKHTHIYIYIYVCFAHLTKMRATQPSRLTPSVCLCGEITKTIQRKERKKRRVESGEWRGGGGVRE
jgi:hypothetical protein